MDLVTISNGQAVTTSRKIAAKFGKKHKDVLRAISKVECSEDFARRNFAPCKYLASNGLEYKEYIIRRDGFVFLVMGFTGKQAAKFKEEYIAAFNEMENQVRKVYDDPIIAMRLKQLEIEQRLTVLEAKQITRPEYFTIAGYAKLQGVSVGFKVAQKLGRNAARICREQGLVPEPITDPRFGRVNSYPKEVLHRVFLEASE